MENSDSSGAAAERRFAEWHRYYGEKRILQQWYQVHLLEGLAVRRVLEVGPYLGLVTALLDNAGYDVTTLDHVPRPFARPDVRHVQADLAALRPEQISGFDAIICCETLEHMPWRDSAAALRTFHDSGARYLIISVPYEAPQLHVLLHVNRHAFRQHCTLRKGRSGRSFPAPADPHGHYWEIGYRGYTLEAWERRLDESGWRIVSRSFTTPSRSVFHVLERQVDANAS